MRSGDEKQVQRVRKTRVCEGKHTDHANVPSLPEETGAASLHTHTHTHTHTFNI